jgi:hypothetical protein
MPDDDSKQRMGPGDTIRLTLPRGRSFRGVAMLVVGGLAARLDLTYENLEDLEIAVESLLQHARGSGEMTLELGVQEGSIAASVGPVDADAVRQELAHESSAEVGLRRVLETVADRHELVEREGMSWLAIEKRLEAGARGHAG